MAAIAKFVSGLAVKGSKGVAFTAGQISALAARIIYATVEGLAFAFGRRGGNVILGAELFVLGYHAGPRRVANTAVGAFVLCAVGRGLWVLLHTAKQQPELEHLGAIWDWEPQGDAYESGAWHVLRALVRTMVKVQKQNPRLDKILSQEPLQPTELARRLYYMYVLEESQPSPCVLHDFEPAMGAAAAPAAAGTPAAALGVGNSQPCADFEVVPVEIMGELEFYRPLACFLYYYADDEQLSQALAEKGYTLCFASYMSDPISCSPAFYMSMSEERKEVVLSLRGTFSPEDVFTDLLAAGVRLRGTAFYCHTGMCKGAMALGKKFGDLLQAASAQGYTVTLVGHSLGAGVAAILACILKDRGLTGLKCYAFETPACVDRVLAEECGDVVISTCMGDDIVPRACPDILARFLEEIAEFNWKEVAGRMDERSGLGVMHHLSQLLRSKSELDIVSSKGSSLESSQRDMQDLASQPPGPRAGTGAGSGTPTAAALRGVAQAVRGAAAQRAAAQPEQQTGPAPSTYDPYVPGRVVYIYRRPEPVANGTGKRVSIDPAVALQAARAMVSLPPEPTGRVLLRPHHPVLRSIRLTEHLVTDHFIDTEFAIVALSVAG